jgi:hypothetical protein
MSEQFPMNVPLQKILNQRMLSWGDLNPDRQSGHSIPLPGKVSNPSNTQLRLMSEEHQYPELFRGGQPHERRKERKKGPAFGSNGGSR